MELLYRTLFFFLFILAATGASTKSAPAPTKPISSSSSPLDPKQVTALRSLGLGISSSCSLPNLCDNSKPFRHLLSLTLSNCSSDLSLTTPALTSLSTLHSLQFLNCPAAPIHLPPSLSSSLTSFTCIQSLRRLTGVWLSKLRNLTDLTLDGVPVSSSGPSFILSNLKHLTNLTISDANLTGYLPKSWHRNITRIDLSGNNLKGRIHSSITTLDNLLSLDLSSNNLSGQIPDSIGDLIDLKNLSLSSNSLSGSIPDSLSAIPSLLHLDLSSNQLNGTVPGFISEMQDLKYLNLEDNTFQGVMPFNASFIKRLLVFKIGGNTDLCYNHSTLSSSKLKLGISPCDKNGLPMSPPSKSDSSGGGGGGGDATDDYNDSSDEVSSKKSSGHRGPNKVVLGIAISLASIVFLILFLIFLSKRCA